MTDFVWEPTPTYVEHANVTRLMRRHGIGDYRDLVKRSQEDIEWFWEAVIEDLGISFFEPYTKVLEASDGWKHPRWFVGDRINLAYNCVDRHASGGRADEPAIVWEGEDGATETLTYAGLEREVNRVANGLLEAGISQGDAVGVYLPMVPQAAVAAYACAKIGAIYLPIFSGFGAPAVATRLNDSEAKALFTADGFYRRGGRVDMKAVADEAVAKSPTVERVFVHRRFAGSEVPMS